MISNVSFSHVFWYNSSWVYISGVIMGPLVNRCSWQAFSADIPTDGLITDVAKWYKTLLRDLEVLGKGSNTVGSGGGLLMGTDKEMPNRYVDTHWLRVHTVRAITVFFFVCNVVFEMFEVTSLISNSFYVEGFMHDCAKSFASCFAVCKPSNNECAINRMLKRLSLHISVAVML